MVMELRLHWSPLGRGRKYNWDELEGTSLGAGHVLFLNLNGGYRNVYSKNSSSTLCTFFVRYTSMEA